MRLIVNGENFDTSDTATVQDLLDKLGIVSGRVAVEVNLSIIRKADYVVHKLSNGDKIEIVNFVGGGSNKEQIDKGRYSIFTHSLPAGRQE